MRRQNSTLALLFLLVTVSGCASADTETGFAQPSTSCEADAAKEAWRPGCATHRNLAVMAARQDDLHLARPEAPRDAMRRDAVIGNYARSSGSADQPVAEAPAVSSSGAGSTQ